MRTYAIRPPAPDDIKVSLGGIPELTADLLVARGITTAAGAEAFLNPSYDAHLHDPFLLPDMEVAIERILRAIRDGERIAIWSDYDCDGIPGGVLLHDFFKLIGYANFENYIPHRHAEGYGLNEDGLSDLASRGAALVITVDCGITDVAAVVHANALGLDVIVTDHHEVGSELPPALAVINPKRPDSAYSFRFLAGTGVAWKMVQALLVRGGFDVPAGKEKWLLDVVGLATVADMVPLVGENRVLAHYGLTVLRKSRRPGLTALLRKMRVRQRDLSEDDIGFMIAPRINAASRMDHPMDAFHLLATRDEAVAQEMAEHLDHINNERKGVVASMVKEIRKRVEALGELRDIIVLGNPLWRPALLGLAANTLVEDYRRPVFLWGREGTELIKGSCRSDGRVNLVSLMSASSHAFLQFGGHAFSGGFSVSHEQIHTLGDELNSAYTRVRESESRVPEQPIAVDRELSLDDVRWETYRAVALLAPFGVENPKPLFLFRAVTPSSARWFGKGKDHLEVMFKNSRGGEVKAINFFSNEEVAETCAGGPVDLVATLERSTFRPTPELRLRIVDVRRA